MSEKFADPEKDLAWAEKQRELLNLRAEGVPVKDAADKLGIHPQHAWKMVREAASEIRAKNRELVDQRFMEHDHRLEWLYRQCVERIQKAAVANDFDANALRAAVAVLDRQAKLLGLDKATTSGGANRTEWLDNAPPEALVKEAERLGLRIPEPFKAAMSS